MTTARTYAGVGSRQTPTAIAVLMRRLAARLAADGYTLHSGGAQGADQAFEQGALEAGGKLHVFRPGPPLRHPHHIDSSLLHAFPEALTLAKRTHPAWGRCSPAAQLLHARNGFQVLSADLASPVRFLVAWTPDYALDPAGRVVSVSGGTGQAVRLAVARQIPVFHLGHEPHLKRIESYLDSGQLGA